MTELPNSELFDARQEALLYRRLYEVTAALSSAALPDEIIAVMFAQGLRALSADSGFIGIVSDDGRNLGVQRFDDYSGAASAALTIPITANVPIAASARDGGVRIIESNDDLACDFPGLERLNPVDHACATIPLSAGGRLWGALNIAIDAPRPFTTAERSLMLLMGEHCGIAFERATRLHRAESRLRNLRALEIHDDVVQDLAVARLALGSGLHEQAMTSLTRGLEAAKRIVTEIAGDALDYRRAERPEGDA
ncbi:MAG: GAF domain-containing protein [Thermoleophilia bacterium]|nr:GAF domain-containing protein [Thermoleophilia bacterium]